jgi:hypothetical protein
MIWDISKEEEILSTRSVEGVNNLKWLKAKENHNHFAVSHVEWDKSIQVYDATEPWYPRYCWQGKN